MLGMDGFALASNIRNSSPRTRIIRITASEPRILREKMRSGCVDWDLFKPFKPKDVVESVKGVFRAGKGMEDKGIEEYVPDLSTSPGLAAKPVIAHQQHRDSMKRSLTDWSRLGGNRRQNAG
jgi:DNA-binding response OmpR family regulator